MPDFPEPKKSSGWDIALPAILGLVAGALPGLGRGVNAGLGVAQMMQKRKDNQLAQQRDEWNNNSVSDMFGSTIAKMRNPIMEPVSSKVTIDPMDVVNFEPLPAIFKQPQGPSLDALMKKTVADNTPSDTGTADMGMWNATAIDEGGTNLLNSHLDMAQAAAKARQWDIAEKNISGAQSLQEESAKRIRERRSFNDLTPGAGESARLGSDGVTMFKAGASLTDRAQKFQRQAADGTWHNILLHSNGSEDDLGPVRDDRPRGAHFVPGDNGEITAITEDGRGGFRATVVPNVRGKTTKEPAPRAARQPTVTIVSDPKTLDDGTRTEVFTVQEGGVPVSGTFPSRAAAGAWYREQQKRQATERLSLVPSHRTSTGAEPSRTLPGLSPRGAALMSKL